MASGPRHLITADDFGYDPGVNEAIAAAFAAGLINSTSIMAGMPGFEAAVELARRERFADAIGAHLNLTEGMPTTDAMKRDPAFCDAGGRYRFSFPRSALRLPASAAAAIHAELSRQIELCLDAGLSLTHLDSHHHVHNVWPIGRIVIALAALYRVPAVRIARNIGPGIGPLKRAFKTAFNVRLRHHNVARTELMGNASDFIDQRPPRHLRAELAVHPGLAGGVIVDREEKAPLAELLQRANLS